MEGYRNAEPDTCLRTNPVETPTVSNVGPSENIWRFSFRWDQILFLASSSVCGPIACSCSRRKDLCSPHLLLQWLHTGGVFLSVNWFREGFNLKKKKKSLVKVEILSNNSTASSPKGKKCRFILPSFFFQIDTLASRFIKRKLGGSDAPLLWTLNDHHKH